MYFLSLYFRNTVLQDCNWLQKTSSHYIIQHCISGLQSTLIFIPHTSEMPFCHTDFSCENHILRKMYSIRKYESGLKSTLCRSQLFFQSPVTRIEARLQGSYNPLACLWLASQICNHPAITHFWSLKVIFYIIPRDSKVKLKSTDFVHFIH